METKYQSQLESKDKEIERLRPKAERWETEIEPLIVDPQSKLSKIVLRLDDGDFNNRLRQILGNQQPPVYPRAFRQFVQTTSGSRYQHDPVRLFVPHLLQLIVDNPVILMQILSYSDRYRQYFKDIDWEETQTNKQAAAAAAAEPVLEPYTE